MEPFKESFRGWQTAGLILVLGALYQFCCWDFPRVIFIPFLRYRCILERSMFYFAGGG